MLQHTGAQVESLLPTITAPHLRLSEQPSQRPPKDRLSLAVLLLLCLQTTSTERLIIIPGLTAIMYFNVNYDLKQWFSDASVNFLLYIWPVSYFILNIALQQSFQEWIRHEPLLEIQTGWWSDGKMDRQVGRGQLAFLDLKWSGSSLEFCNIHSWVVSMSPRLTFLMQDWGIQRSAPLKFLVGVRREAARLLKTVCDIDIKTQHIEWCQLKFHSVPFGKLGSWTSVRWIMKLPSLCSFFI